MNDQTSETTATQSSESRRVICGHTAESPGAGSFTCYLPPNHKGLHEETFRTRDGYVERTNWGSDGLAPHATKDRP